MLYAEGAETKARKESRSIFETGSQLRLRGIASTVVVVALFCGLALQRLPELRGAPDAASAGALAALVLACCIIVAWYVLDNR